MPFFSCVGFGIRAVACSMFLLSTHILVIGICEYFEVWIICLLERNYCLMAAFVGENWRFAENNAHIPWLSFRTFRAIPCINALSFGDSHPSFLHVFWTGLKRWCRSLDIAKVLHTQKKIRAYEYKQKYGAVKNQFVSTKIENETSGSCCRIWGFRVFLRWKRTFRCCITFFRHVVWQSIAVPDSSLLWQLNW